VVSQSLIAFDTDHIKRYVFGTSKLKEIRGASSILDQLNRVETVRKAESDFRATKIYANGGSALFLIDSDKAESLGKAVQNLYYDTTGGGASIAYAIQSIPDNDSQNLMTATKLNEDVEMSAVLELLRIRLRLAKDGQQVIRSKDDSQQENVADIIALPSHSLLCTCNSCGMNYAEKILKDPSDLDEPEGRYCRVCEMKRKENESVTWSIQDLIRTAQKQLVSNQTLWGRILQVLSIKDATGQSLYALPAGTERPKDFNVFREFAHGKEYLGLIYADANGMGKVFSSMDTLQAVQDSATQVDEAVFDAMGDAVRMHLPVQGGKFPFDILLIGGDDIVIVTPADKALQVARTLAEKFNEYTDKKYTLSVGVVLAPVKYPFSQSRMLVEETLKAAKKSGAISNRNGSSEQEQSRINFLVVTGNTSLSYGKIYDQTHGKKSSYGIENEFYATMRPYTLSQLNWLLDQLREGNKMRLGRTKLHQLREAILKLDNTRTILEALALLRNWKEKERNFIKDMVRELDIRQTMKQQQMGTLFPWFLDGKESRGNRASYRTPLLDFIELYDFVSF